ncbi:MAG: magnesium/cobalt transporter CorA [Schleiferiaceae bacterium]
MAVQRKRRNKKQLKPVGAAPGSLVYTGNRSQDISFDLVEYGPEGMDEERDLGPEVLNKKARTGYVQWININGIHDTDLVREIGENAGIPVLFLEDLLNVNQRPKMEVDPGSQNIFVTVKMLRYTSEKKHLDSEQVSFILTPDKLYSFQEIKGDVFEPVRNRLRHGNIRIRQNGIDYLLYALIDTIIDHYFFILEEIEEDLEQLEDSIFENTDTRHLQEIQVHRKNIFTLKRAIFPLREAVAEIRTEELDLISDHTRNYLRDVYDHVIQLIDLTDVLKEFNGGLKDVYLNTVSLKMNQIMQVLTIMSTIFIPLTFIAGIYGMNFEYMPELHAKHGYFWVLGIMVVMVVGMVFFFRRKKWL